MEAAAGPDVWFLSLPLMTKVWLGSTAVVTIAVNMQLMDFRDVRWINWEAVYGDRKELWRIVTPFLYVGRFEFNTLVCFLLLSQFSQRYEQGGPYNTGGGGRTADYCFMLLFLMTTTLATLPVLSKALEYYYYNQDSATTMSARTMPVIFSRTLIYSLLYIWSKRFREAEANIYGIPIPALYLPFVHLGYSMFMGGSYIDIVQGLAVGHCYYFLVAVLPLQRGGRGLLKTPQFFIDWFHGPEITFSATAAEHLAEHQPPPRQEGEQLEQEEVQTTTTTRPDGHSPSEPEQLPMSDSSSASAQPRENETFGNPRQQSERNHQEGSQSTNNSSSNKQHNWGESGQRLGDE